jgi:hypothetical protein
MPFVRLTLESNIKRLEAESSHGHRIGANVFYVSLTNEKEEEENWGPLWNDENKFELFLKATLVLSSLQGRMFFICDGSHRFKA